MEAKTKKTNLQNLMDSGETVATLASPDPEIQRAKNEFSQLLRRQTKNRIYNKNFLCRKERITILFGVMQKIVNYLDFSPQIFCKTIHIFDAIISRNRINKLQMFSVALVSMQIASKIHQPQGQVISYEEVSQYFFPLGIDQFLQIEKMIIEQLEFNLNLAGPNEILNFLLWLFFKKEYNFFGRFEHSIENKKKFVSLVFKLHLITLVEYEFYKFNSIAVAVSILIFARLLMNLDPWPSKMEEFVGFSMRHVIECLNMLNTRNEGNYLIVVFQKLDEIEMASSVSEESTRLSLSFCSLFNQSEKYFLSETVVEKFFKLS